MHLKTYQSRILQELSAYLSALKKQRDIYDGYTNHTDENIRRIATHYDFTQEAWQECTGNVPQYHSKQDGLNAPMPDIYIKVPTGGGKTLLAVHAADAINRQYLNRNTGITLWIVPSEQIYRQTLNALKDRNHPYRQLLDVAAGGRVLVRERRQTFTPTECAGQHIILLLMLPAANRENTETLRMFQDSGGYDAFFPPEDDAAAHAALLQKTPNLDCFGSEDALLPKQVKSSLGNVLRLQRPLVVVDEGQRAYSALARDTIRKFNPTFVLELSATPPPNSNVLTQANGRELDNEEMIKLDIHLTNQQQPDWKNTLLKAVNKRVELEAAADHLGQNSGRYIRPITLVQVERTGKEMQDGRRVHSEDARDYLIHQCNIPPQQIAVKSAEINELGDSDLLAQNCDIRYIITKQALQEGWDCAFAYVLAVLSNMGAETALTQLIGRILRQPYAKKTAITALNECYVFTNSSSTGKIAEAIKKNLEKEGLEGMGGCVRGGDEGDKTPPAIRQLNTARQFRRFAGKIYLPQFVVLEKKRPRPLDYERDILANLDWENLTAPALAQLALADTAHDLQQMRIGWRQGADELMVLEQQESYTGLAVDPLLMTRQLLDVIPNPWHAYAKTRAILTALQKREQKRGMQNGISAAARMNLNFVFIMEETKRQLAAARDEMARQYFMQKIQAEEFQLMLFTAQSSDFHIPPNVNVRSTKRMNRADGSPLQRSFFDYVPDEDSNDWERGVALYLDEQERLLWWYRNQVSSGYAIQGWKRGRIYPDFIAAKKADKRAAAADISKVLVLETKGRHLAGSDDTEYKRTMLDLCTQLCNEARKPKLCRWRDLAKDFSNYTFRFQMVDQDGWENTINSLLNCQMP